jgi:hypothetical protein
MPGEGLLVILAVGLIAGWQALDLHAAGGGRFAMENN